MKLNSLTSDDADLNSRGPLEYLLCRVRHRALLLIATQSLVHALLMGGVLGGLLLAVGSAVGLSWSLIGWIVLALVVVAVAWLTRRRLGRREAYLRAVDHRYDAAGRLIVASEFLANGRELDAFRKLALADAAKWIDARRATRLPWIWPSRWPAALLVLVSMAVWSTGCQKPTPPAQHSAAAAPHGSIPVAPPDGGSQTSPVRTPPPPPAESPQNPFGKPADRPNGVTYGADEFPSDRGGGSSGGRSSGGQGRGTGVAQGSNGGQSRAPGAPGGGGSGGSGAGTSGGPKQADPRGVQAAKKDVEATGSKGAGKPSGPNRVGKDSKPGEKFAGGAAPGATTRPAAIIGFDGVEIDEMTLERLPPDQRERIRQYNENLRKLREQQSSTGGS